MCGIIGYTGKKNAKDVLISGLKRLEYRGYDSAGIAVTCDNNIDLYKSLGKIVNLEKLVDGKNVFSNTGIGHTRWATHGIPSTDNAHPHKHGRVTLVHNGIIENYAELKEELLKTGLRFLSETDTEVACAYINMLYAKNPNKLEVIKEACNTFRGSYAFGIIFEDEPTTIYATRLGSPLIVGVGDGSENYISSDISAILNYTNKYILLEPGEIAVVNKDSYKIYDFLFNILNKEIQTATWSADEYQKNGYEHFMLKEINEQPKVLNELFARYFKHPTYEINIDFNKYTNIHIVACGSAMHSGLVGKYLIETYGNIPVTVEVASEYRYKNQLINDHTLVIIISQSGETADTLAALRIAKEKGALTLAIVNAVGSTIAREADHTIYTYAGPEIAVATTKGYTTQVGVLSTIALNIAKYKNNLSNEEVEKIYSDYLNIEKNLNFVINNYKEDYIDIAKDIYIKDNLFFIGRGIDSSICMEGSLKLKEISYMHSESYAAGELKHGTISLIENGTPVIAIASDDALFEKTVSNIKETKARGSYTIFITTDKLLEKYFGKDLSSQDFADRILVLPAFSDFVNAISITTALQLIAYNTAKLRGCDIDKPRNLAKSVTVE